jgi:site-specific recombinase XerD
VGDFERFLLVGKGASAATQQCYVRHVQAMLAELCDATGTIDLGRVSATWVRSYVTRLGGRYASQSLKLMATAVRSFLRYAWMSGWTAGDLTGAVGPVITHRSGRLPRALAAEDLRRLLTSPDRRTTTGLRDHALRGGRLRLPIPADVGPVVVTYLQRRPAAATCREVFVQVRGEPKPMTSRAVTQVVARHAARAGLGTVRAHRLRHSAARAVLVAGGSLSEVGQLLGHANGQVSMIYASFDQQSLAVLVRPWPTAAGGRP